MAGKKRPAARRHRRWSPIERDLRAAGHRLIAGVDEVGRGPLAGPVVACAVIMPPDARAIAGVDDSKRLSPADRVRLAERIRSRALAIGLGAASVREIDRINIYHASVLAMRRALSRLAVAPDHVLVDGKPIRTLGVPHQAVVGGDARCYAIACASIVAKVTRDRLMEALARRHPEYLWERNAGYATADHLAGLARVGLTAHHRRSFCRVEQLSLDLLAPPPDGAPADDAPLVEELTTGELLESPDPTTEELIVRAIELDAASDADTPTVPADEAPSDALSADGVAADGGGDGRSSPA